MKPLIPILVAAAITTGFVPSDVTAATGYYGRINVTLHIYIVTPIPAGDEVGCSATATGVDTTSTHTETAFLVASQISASPLEYECVFSIPWEWELTGPTAVSVVVHGGAGYLPTGSTNPSGLSRSSDHSFTSSYNLSVSPAAISQTIDLRL